MNWFEKLLLKLSQTPCTIKSWSGLRKGLEADGLEGVLTMDKEVPQHEYEETLPPDIRPSSKPQFAV